MINLATQTKRQYGEHGMLWNVDIPTRRQSYEEVMLAGFEEAVVYYLQKYPQEQIACVELHGNSELFDAKLKPIAKRLGVEFRYRTFGLTRDVFVIASGKFNRRRSHPQLKGE